MPQIVKGTTFVDNMVVTKDLLNALVDGAQLGSQSITQQTQITDGIVANDDYVTLYDTSTTNLRKATVGQVVGSNIPVVASTITGQATQTSTTAGTYLATADLALNPQDSASISGTYLSADGITVTVTTTNPHQVTVGQYVQLASAGTYSGTYRVVSVPTTTTLTITIPPVYGVGTFLSANGTTVTVTSINPHFLTSGQVIKIDASIPSYSGSYTINVPTGSTTTFTYTLSTAATATGTTSYTMSFKRSALVPATSTSCTFIKKGSSNVNGNEIISANKYTNGDSIQNGISTFNNTTIHNGDTIFAGNTVLAGNNQFNGTTNFVGTVQKQGTVVPLPIYTFFTTREQAVYACNRGGASDLANPYGTVIALASITATNPLAPSYTAKKAGNVLFLEWDISYETYWEGVLIVTRTPLSGAGVGVAVPLPNQVNSNNDTWSGFAIANPYDYADNTSTPVTQRYRVIDTNTLAVPCMYELRCRGSRTDSAPFNFALNRTNRSTGTTYDEALATTVVVTELWV